MAGLVFVGAATYDVIAAVPAFPGPDERVVAISFAHAGGGNAATSAVTAARLGVPAAFVGPIGDGIRGERVLADLERAGVDVSGVVRVPDDAAGESVVLVDAAAATRAIVTRPVPPFTLPPAGRGARQVRSSDWVHVDHRGWPPLAALLGERVGERFGGRVSVDEGNPIPGLALPAVELYVPTAAVLRARYGEPLGGPSRGADREVGALLDRALADGARVVVATDGARGSVAASRPGQRLRVPALPVEVVSTLGAGDVFHGALLAGLWHGGGLDTAVRYATVAAGLSCRTLDARSGLPDDAQVRAHLAVAGSGLPATPPE